MNRGFAAIAWTIGCVWALWFSLGASAQTPRETGDFQLTKINRSLVQTPIFEFSGGQDLREDERDRWLVVEAEFSAAPEFTDELSFRYFVLINGKLLSGEVTHVNIAAGRENRSVMYVSPRALARLVSNRIVIENSIQNIAVQIVQQGVVKSELSMGRAHPQWFADLPKTSGFLLNKNETPFAPLYWDHYEQIKTPGR